MPIIRPVLNRDYTIIPNRILNDSRLSLDTRGLLRLLLSKPEDWEVIPDYMRKLLGKDGHAISKDKWTRMIREAKAAGYWRRSELQCREKNGKWSKYIYYVGLPEDLDRVQDTFDVTPLPRDEKRSPGDRETGEQSPHIYKIQSIQTRACPQLRRMIAETSWTAARKFRASLS